MLIAKLRRFSDKQKTSNVGHWTNQAFASMWLENLRREENIGDKSKIIKKKQKRLRTAFSTEQIQKLESTFSCHKYISKEIRSELSNLLKLDTKCIKVWFQNRRMKEKRQILSEARAEQLETRGDSTTEEFNTPVSYQTASIVHSSPATAITEHLDDGRSNQFAYSTSKSYDIPTTLTSATFLQQSRHDSGFYYESYGHYNVVPFNQLPKYGDDYLHNNDSHSGTYNFDRSSYSTNYYPVDFNNSTNLRVEDKCDTLFAEKHYSEPYHNIYYDLN